MTHAMWGIAFGLALILAVSLRRYMRGVQRKQEIRWLNEHHVLNRLRERLRLSAGK